MTRYLPLAVLMLVLAAQTLHAATLSAEPSLSMSAEWDSNPFNRPQGLAEDDVLARVTPRLTLMTPVMQSDLSLAGGCEFQKYFADDQDRKLIGYADVGLFAQRDLKVSPRFSFKPSLRFVQTYDSARLAAPPGGDAGGVSGGDTTLTPYTKVQEFSASVDTTSQLSPLIEMLVNGSVIVRHYPQESPGLFGSSTANLDMTLSRRLSPVVAAGFFAEWSYYAYEDNPNASNIDFGLSAVYNPTTLHTLDVRIGATYIREDVEGTMSDDWSPFMRTTLTYKASDFQANAHVSYEYIGGGPFGAPTHRGTAQAGLSDQFAPGWWWNLTASYQRNRSTDSPPTQDLGTASGGGGVRYQISRRVTANLNGTVYRQSSAGVSGSDVNRETVALGIMLSDTYAILK